MTISQVRRLARPIAAIIAIAAPMSAAVNVTNDDLTLTVGVQIQARGDATDAHDSVGKKYNVEGGTDFNVPAAADFYLRRARVSFKGVYKGDWGFNLTFRDDGAGRAGSNTTSAGETPLMQQAFVYRVFKMGDIKQQIQLGQDYAYHNRANNVVSSAELLLPNLSATAALLNSRAPGHRLPHLDPVGRCRRRHPEQHHPHRRPVWHRGQR